MGTLENIINPIQWKKQKGWRTSYRSCQAKITNETAEMSWNTSIITTDMKTPTCFFLFLFLFSFFFFIFKKNPLWLKGKTTIWINSVEQMDVKLQ